MERGRDLPKIYQYYTSPIPMFVLGEEGESLTEIKTCFLPHILFFPCESWTSVFPQILLKTVLLENQTIVIFPA